MALRGPPKFGQSSQSSGKGGRPGQGPQKRQPTSEYQQYAAVPYPACEVPLLYETPLHAQMEVKQKEERYKCPVRNMHHKHYYQPGPSRCQAPVKTYAHTVALPAEREYVPQVQLELGTEALLQRLEAAGQPVPPVALFLQDNLAVMVMEGLLDQIELMRRQHIATLEQIERAAKCKLSPQEGVSGEPRRLKPFPSWGELVAPSGASSSVPMLAWPTTASTLTAAIKPVLPTIAPSPSATSGVVAAEPLQAPAAPMMELSLDQ
ncbi:hypothetical protein C0992_003813 [Termitomyces sp. T32_za158]|nr:hypothetical protein C0992_003813 [Termitomyces sp. T32_za158]